MENGKLFEFMEKMYSEMQQGFKEVHGDIKGMKTDISEMKYNIRKIDSKIEEMDKKVGLFLVLAQYVESGKKLWWVTDVPYLWKEGGIKLVSGTTIYANIIDVIEITDGQAKIYRTIDEL